MKVGSLPNFVFAVSGVYPAESLTHTNPSNDGLRKHFKRQATFLERYLCPKSI